MQDEIKFDENVVGDVASWEEVGGKILPMVALTPYMGTMAGNIFNQFVLRDDEGNKREVFIMKKEISIFERPEKFTEQYLKAYGNMSWYDFVTAMRRWYSSSQVGNLTVKKTPVCNLGLPLREAELTSLSVSWEKSIKTGICINH